MFEAARLRDALTSSGLVEFASPDDVTAVPGAYALLLHVPHAVPFSRRAIPATSLSGWFVYVGSAHGSGGMAARVARHCRPDKPVRWHIDELTNAADRITAFAIAGGRECDIVDRLLKSGQFETSLAGFGSSDCRRCAAHLLKPYRS